MASGNHNVLLRELDFNPFAALLTSYLVMRKPVAVCPSDEYTRHNPIAVMLSVAHSVAAIF